MQTFKANTCNSVTYCITFRTALEIIYKTKAKFSISVMLPWKGMSLSLESSVFILLEDFLWAMIWRNTKIKQLLVMSGIMSGTTCCGLHLQIDLKVQATQL